MASYIGNLIGSRIHRVLHDKPKDPRNDLADLAQQLEALFRECAGHLSRDPAARLLHDVSHLAADLGRRLDIAENGAHHASYTRNKVDRVDQATSDQLYAGIPSLRENFRLADPSFLTMAEEFGDDTTTQILSLFPNFVLQQIQKQHCIAPGIAERPGQDRAAMDLYRLRGSAPR